MEGSNCCELAAVLQTYNSTLAHARDAIIKYQSDLQTLKAVQGCRKTKRQRETQPILLENVVTDSQDLTVVSGLLGTCK